MFSVQIVGRDWRKYELTTEKEAELEALEGRRKRLLQEIKDIDYTDKFFEPSDLIKMLSKLGKLNYQIVGLYLDIYQKIVREQVATS